MTDPKQKTAATAGPSTPKKGTDRWPKNATAEGEFILLPKVLLQRLREFDLEPRHLWLLLVLQAARYENRDPRFYWDELAAFCGKKRNAVRRWAYELRDKGLLKIQQLKKLNPDEHPRPGYRNERNRFVLTPFVQRVEQEHEKWLKARTQRRKPKASKK